MPSPIRFVSKSDVVAALEILLADARTRGDDGTIRYCTERLESFRPHPIPNGVRVVLSLCDRDGKWIEVPTSDVDLRVRGEYVCKGVTVQWWTTDGAIRIVVPGTTPICGVLR